MEIPQFFPKQIILFCEKNISFANRPEKPTGFGRFCRSKFAIRLLHGTSFGTKLPYPIFSEIQEIAGLLDIVSGKVVSSFMQNVG
jgi:hypothetical protein